MPRLRPEVRCTHLRHCLLGKLIPSCFSNPSHNTLDDPWFGLNLSALNRPQTLTMASRCFNRASRAPLMRQFALPSTQRRTLFTSLGNAGRGTFVPPKAAINPALQISRGMKTIDFAGHKETVYGKLNREQKTTINTKINYRARRLAKR